MAVDLAGAELIRAWNFARQGPKQRSFARNGVLARWREYPDLPRFWAECLNSACRIPVRSALRDLILPETVK